jgi:hypothetical protein
MTQKQEFNRIKNDNKLFDKTSDNKKRKFRSNFSQDKLKQLVIDVVIKNNVTKKELVVLTNNNNRIYLDTLGAAGNLSFLNDTSYIIDCCISSLSKDPEDFLVMIYFNVGNLIVYKGKEFSEIENTDFPIFSDQPYANNEWGRYCIIKHDFWIISPYPIQIDNLNETNSINPRKALAYFSDRSAPFGYRDTGVNAGLNLELNTRYGSVNYTYTNTQILPEFQPVYLENRIFNINNILKIYDNLESNGSSSGINQAKYDHPLINSVSGNKSYTVELLETVVPELSPVKGACIYPAYDFWYSFKFNYNFNLEYKIIYGDSTGLKSETINTRSSFHNSPLMMMYKFPDITQDEVVYNPPLLDENGVVIEPAYFSCGNIPIRYGAWVYNGIKEYGSYEYKELINIPEDIYGNSYSIINCVKSSKNFDITPFPYGYGVLVNNYYELPNNIFLDFKNTYGLELPRNIDNDYCGARVLTPKVQVTQIKQYPEYNIPSPLDNISSAEKYYFRTLKPRTIKTIQGNLQFGEDCSYIKNPDEFPEFNFTIGETQHQKIFTKSDINSRIDELNQPLYNLGLDNDRHYTSINFVLPIVENSINTNFNYYQQIFITEDSKLFVLENNLDQFETALFPSTAFAIYQFIKFYNFYSNNSIILAMSYFI